MLEQHPYLPPTFDVERLLKQLQNVSAISEVSEAALRVGEV